MLVLLIISTVECNARAGPDNYLEHAKHSSATKEEKAMHIPDHQQVLPSNQNAGSGNAGVVPSKNMVLADSRLTKGSLIPLSVPQSTIDLVRYLNFEILG